MSIALQCRGYNNLPFCRLNTKLKKPFRDQSLSLSFLLRSWQQCTHQRLLRDKCGSRGGKKRKYFSLHMFQSLINGHAHLIILCSQHTGISPRGDLALAGEQRPVISSSPVLQWLSLRCGWYQHMGINKELRLAQLEKGRNTISEQFALESLGSIGLTRSISCSFFFYQSSSCFGTELVLSCLLTLNFPIKAMSVMHALPAIIQLPLKQIFSFFFFFAFTHLKSTNLQLWLSYNKLPLAQTSKC